MSEGSEIDRPWEMDFEVELRAQRRAESLLMLRGAAILIMVAAVAVVRAALL